MCGGTAAQVPDESTNTAQVIDENVKTRPVVDRNMNYDDYIAWQKHKSTDPVRRHRWKTVEWHPKLEKFKTRFQIFKERDLISDNSKVLLIGARTGQEVHAMREIGVHNSIGIDIVEDLPLVIASDMHNISFSQDTFDFVFSNVFDHSLHPEKFSSEVRRVLKTGGHVCLHCALNVVGDSYTANRISVSDDAIKIMSPLKVISTESISMLGMDHELCFVNNEE